MGQWGTQRFQGNSAPNWYVDLTTDDTGAGTDDRGHLKRGYTTGNNTIYSRPNHPAAAENLEATDRGWVRVIKYKDSSGAERTKREIVVAQGNLANTLSHGSEAAAAPATSGGPQIVDIRWGAANNSTGRISGTAGGDGILYAAADEVTVVVTFDQPVVVEGAGNGTTNFLFANVETGTTSGGAVAGGAAKRLICHAKSGNGTNQIVFANTIGKTAAEALSIPDTGSGRQPFIVAGGTGKIKAVQPGGLSGRDPGATGAIGSFDSTLQSANTQTGAANQVANGHTFGVFGFSPGVTNSLQGRDGAASRPSEALGALAGIRKVSNP